MNFTDAIAAIAITLLILPLVGAVPDTRSADDTVGKFLAIHSPELVSFLISFAVIARLWVAHHHIFDHVGGINRGLIFLSILWSATIVFLPLPTAMTATFEADRAMIALYIGTMALSSLTLSAIVLTVRNNPALGAVDRPVTSDMVVGSVSTSLAFLVALAIGVVFPALNYWALLVLLVPAPRRLLRRLATSRGRDE